MINLFYFNNYLILYWLLFIFDVHVSKVSKNFFYLNYFSDALFSNKVSTDRSTLSFTVNKNRNLILWNVPTGDRIHRKHRSHSTFFVRSFTHRENEVSCNRVTAKQPMLYRAVALLNRHRRRKPRTKYTARIVIARKRGLRDTRA